MEKDIYKIYMEEIKEILNSKESKKIKEKFLEYHPFEQKDAFLRLEEDEQRKIVSLLSAVEITPFFEQLEEHQMLQFFKEYEKEYNSKIIENMSIDDAVDLLKLMSKEERNSYLSLLPKTLEKELNKFANYKESTAGSLMTNEFIELNPTDNVKEAMKKLVKQAPNIENIHDLYVIERKKLVGVLSLKELIVARADKDIKDIMREKIISVTSDEDQLNVANIVKDYDLILIPVTDESNNMLGIISIDDVVDVIDEEAVEDFSKFAAISNAEIDHENETIFKSVKNRLPWLLVLLILGIGISVLISGFEEILQEVVILSFFMTMLLGMAGNAGTQSLAVTVRGITTNQFDTRRKNSKHLFRELLTGAVNGILVGIAVFIVVNTFLIFRPSEFDALTVSIVVSLSMFISLIVSTLAGAFIPIVMNKLRIDPAVASGPVITSINDIIAILIYFSLARIFLL